MSVAIETPTTLTREQWLAERRKGIGGSDAAAVAGQSEWRTPLQVFLDKVGELVGDETQEMYRGRVLEPAVRQYYADATGLTVRTPQGIVKHPKYPFVLANLDGIAADRVVVDFKTARSKQGWGEPGTDEVPIDYLFQIQHYMAVTGLEMGEIAVLFGNFEFAIYSIPADAEFQAMLMDAERAFWDRVVRRDAPDPTCAADALQQWPLATRSNPVQADEQVIAVCRELAIVKEDLAALTAEKEALDCQVKAAIADCDSLMDGDTILATWKNCKPSLKFDLDAFKAQHPDLFDAYLREGKPSRRFLLKTKAGEPCKLPSNQTPSITAQG